MSENASIARPYAQAVFEMARDSGNFSTWSEALGALAALAQEPQVNALFAHPGEQARWRGRTQGAKGAVRMPWRTGTLMGNRESEQAL